MGGNTNWQFNRPQISWAATVYDDVIRVEFDRPIENSNNEISAGLMGSTIRAGVNGNTYTIIGTYVDAGCTNSTDGKGDIQYFYLKTSSTWNTDATGTSAGDSNSTDRSGIHRSSTADISILKGALYAADGKTMIQHYGNHGNPAYTGTVDRCRPVLVGVERGRASQDPTKNYDAHNYLQLRYSEPVDIGSAPEFTHGNLTASNVKSQNSFGAASDHGGYLSGIGTLTLAGYGTVNGTILLQSRDPSQAMNSEVNALYRASPNAYGAHGLYISIAGYSFGTAPDLYWPGYIHYEPKAVAPAGVFKSTYNDFILDAQGNTFEPAEDTLGQNYAIPGATPYPPNNDVYYGNDYSKAPVTVVVTPSVHDWDTDPPAFSTYLPGDIKEVVSRATTITNLVNRMEFFIQDNSTEDDAWNPTEHWTGTPDPDAHPDRVASRTHFNFGKPWLPDPDVPRGIRDSTWSYPDALDEKLAFQFEAVGITPLLNTYNTGFDTTVNNTLFTEVNTRDDPYFTVLLQDTGHPWGLITQLWFTYDHTKAYLTDLAGNLLPSTPYPYLAIERTPPTIELALASANDSKVYIKFSEPVFGDKSNSVEITSSKFTLNNGFSVTMIEPITRGDNPLTVYDAWLYLNRTLTPDELLTTTLALEGPVSGDPTKGVWDKTGNAALSTDVHRITDVGLGVVTPIWASDGLAVEGKPMDQSSNTLRVFDGTGRLQVRDIVLQARIEASSFTNLPLTLFYDVDVPEQYFNKTDDDPRRNFPHIWLPIRLRGLNPLGNPFAREVFPYESQGALKNFLLPGTDSEFQSGKKVEFIFRLGNLFCARLADPTDPTSLVPWSFMLQEPIRQRGGVSIYNNVINPENGEKAVLTYEVTRPGMVTVQVFSLDGSLVYVIHRGPQGKGTYTYTWNGRNMGNRIVARGIYFIRVVGPDMDEIRKVMVVK